MKKKQILILTVLVIGIITYYNCRTQNLICTNSQISQPFLDSLEIELQKLKNQAFCNCFNQALKNTNATITVPDGSDYIQIFDLDLAYLNSNHLWKLIDDWNKKEYIAYNEENKLFLMRCLDFYNSKDLELYIDSIRQVEILKRRIDAEKRHAND